MTDKLRKYVLPNIPYVFIGWVFLKLGTAYRLAAGSDFAHKLLGLGQTVGAAFADFAPGLAPFDWLVGIVGAVAFRLLIYFKSKNAKKFRRDAEYGSARWGNEKDIKPFVDPKFENNMLLTATERLTMNTRPKNPANARNLELAGQGHHLHADRGALTGPVRKLQSEHPTAGAGTDDPKRACHHARRSVYFAAQGTAAVLFQEIRFETASQLPLYGGGR